VEKSILRNALAPASRRGENIGKTVGLIGCESDLTDVICNLLNDTPDVLRSSAFHPRSRRRSPELRERIQAVNGQRSIPELDELDVTGIIHAFFNLADSIGFGRRDLRPICNAIACGGTYRQKPPCCCAVDRKDTAPNHPCRFSSRRFHPGIQIGSFVLRALFRKLLGESHDVRAPCRFSSP